MAWKMSYTDNAGNVYPDSYWKFIGWQTQNSLTRTGNLLFQGFKDQACREELKSAIGVKTYAINPSDYATYFLPSVLKANSQTEFDAAYAYSMATLDISAPTDDNPDATASFFNGAVEV